MDDFEGFKKSKAKVVVPLLGFLLAAGSAVHAYEVHNQIERQKTEPEISQMTLDAENEDIRISLLVGAGVVGLSSLYAMYKSKQDHKHEQNELGPEIPDDSVGPEDN